MKLKLVHVAKGGAALLLALACIHHLPAAQTPAARDPGSAGWQSVDVFQTNRSTRYITNVIEVRAPQNVFVNEYRTNWIQRTVTNVVNVPVTNWLAKVRTNTVPVTLFRTNVVDRYETNWLATTLTNTVPVTLVRTTMVDRYFTNLTTLTVTNVATLSLTNWETVMVTRTNWIHQPVTNFFDANIPFTTSVLVPERAPQPVAKVEPAPAAPVPDVLTLEAVKTARPFDDNGVEISFRAALSRDAATRLSALQWRVERDDGAVLFVAQTQEFSKRLPTGRYYVEAQARRSSEGPLLSAKIVLEVAPDAVARR